MVDHGLRDDPRALEASKCTGAGDCPAGVHIAGCYATVGSGRMIPAPVIDGFDVGDLRDRLVSYVQTALRTGEVVADEEVLVVSTSHRGVNIQMPYEAAIRLIEVLG